MSEFMSIEGCVFAVVGVAVLAVVGLYFMFDKLLDWMGRGR